MIRLDHDVVAAVDPLDPRRTITERPIDARLPQIGHLFKRPIAVKPAPAQPGVSGGL